MFLKIAKRLRNRNKERLVKPQKVPTIQNFQAFLIKNNECKKVNLLKIQLFSILAYCKQPKEACEEDCQAFCLELEGN